MPQTHLYRPEQVLPDPSRIISTTAVDTEGSGLYPDAGATICAVSTAFRTKDRPDERQTFAFPFDQGRPTEKGFVVQRYKAGQAKGVASEEELEDWLAEVNLPESDWDWLLDWLEATGRETGHTYQNASYDLLMFADAGVRKFTRKIWLEPFVVWDTMLASKNLWPTQLTGLKPTGERLWGAAEVDDAKAVKDALAVGKKLYGLRQEHGPRYDLIPWSINGPYAGQDTNLTLRLQEYQYDLLDEGQGAGWRDFSDQMNLMRVLTRMSHRGFGPYRVVESHDWANTIAARAEELAVDLPFVRRGSLPSDKITIRKSPMGILGGETSDEGEYVSASDTRATEYYYEVLGLSPWKIGEQPRGYEVGKGLHKKFVRSRKGDKPEIERRFPLETRDKDIVFKQGSCTADIAERMGRDGAPGGVEYAEYLRLKIANQMFYRNYAELAGEDYQLRTTYRQAFVKSGRMSVERYQAQAMPKGLHLDVAGVRAPEPRAFFHVRPGRVRWNLDLSQAELRIAANLALCAGLMRELNEEDGDVHGKTCERTFGITPEHPDWKAKRDVAKRLNFGGIFMIGARTFQTNLWTQGGIEWPFNECRKAVYAFREAYPEIEKAYVFWQDYCRMHNNVVLYNGDRAWFGPRDYDNTAWNRVVQGSLARWVAEWLTLVEQMTEKDEALVLTVHDSAVLDLPEDTAEDTVKRVVEVSTELWYDRFGFPGKVDADTWKYHEGVDLLVPASLARYQTIRGEVCETEEISA